MELIQKSEAVQIAEELDSLNTNAITSIRKWLQRSWALANSPGQQQATLDVFGVNAADGMKVYATLYAALVELDAAEGVHAPDTEHFVVNQDGTITYAES